MTQGIRAYAIERFNKHLPKLAELGNTEFRRKVMTEVAKKFDLNVASAATHYNHALKTARAENPKAVEGLGRPEDKKGGRPVLHPVTLVRAKSRKVVQEGMSRQAATEAVKAAEASGKVKLAILEDLIAADEAAAAEAA